MKKLILLSLIISLSIWTLSAEITSTDLLLKNSLSEKLFPEQNYSVFPSVLTEIQSTVIIPYISVNGGFDRNTSERTDDSTGKDGGLYDNSVLELTPEIDLSSFFKQEGGGVFGFDLNLDSYHSLTSEKDYYYSSASANTLSDYDENSLSGGSDLYYAFSFADSSSMGFKLSYDFTWDPAVFENVEDYAASSVLNYYNDYTTGGDEIDEYIHAVKSSIGYSLPISDLKLNLGLNYSGYYDDRNRLFLITDTNGDSYDDTIQLASDYYSSQAAVTGYEYIDYSLYNNLDFASSLVLPVNSSFGFALSGTYTIIDYLYSYYAEHILSSTTPSDSSYTTTAFDAGLGSFEVMAAIDFKGEDDSSNFRIGLDYGKTAQNYSQDDMNTSGTSSTYNDVNTGNLTELSLGASPDDDALSDDNDLNPVSEIIHRLSLITRYETYPADKVTFIVDMSISAFYKVDSYRAFNTDTTSIWEEVNTSDGLNWDIGSYCGISLPVNEEWVCTFGVNSGLTSGDLSFEAETLPSAVLDGTETNDGSDIDGSLNLDFSFSLKFVYSI